MREGRKKAFCGVMWCRSQLGMTLEVKENGDRKIYRLG